MKTAFKKYGILGAVFYSRAAVPVGLGAIKLNISPNKITVSGFLILVIGCYLLTYASFTISAIGFALLHMGVVFDYADGIVARTTGKTSYFGAWLDNSLDRAADFLVMLPIAIVLISKSTTYGGWISLLSVGAIFTVQYAHYIHDIGFFYNLQSPKSDKTKNPDQNGTLYKAFSLWMRVFNRDTTVLILSSALLFDFELIGYISVFIISVGTILLLFARETYLYSKKN